MIEPVFEATPEEHITVLAYEKRLTKFEFLVLFMAALSFISDLAVLFDFLFLGNCDNSLIKSASLSFILLMNSS